MTPSGTSPLVSVIIPTWNRRQLLRETLASVRAQTYGNWEIIVVDDGSSDGTREMVEGLASADRRVRFVRREREPSGAPACRNIGLAAANGEFILFLDSDDLLRPTCLEFRVEKLKADPTLKYVVGQSERFKATPGDIEDETSWWEERHNLVRSLCLDFPWRISSPLWHKSVFAEMGGWDESLQTGQDADMTTRALIHGFGYAQLLRRDYYIRINHSGIGSKFGAPEGQESNLRRVETVRRLLDEREMLKGAIRTIVAGNYLWIAQNLASIQRLDEALPVWGYSKRFGLVTGWQHLVGGMWLRAIARGNWASRIFAPVAAFLLPRGCLIWPSKPGTGQRRVDAIGKYRPVHCPQKAYGCAVEGDFTLCRWLTYPFRRLNPRSAG